MMTFLNDVSDVGTINRAEYKTLLMLLNPFAPHMTEEIWQQNQFGGQIAHQQWPTFDEEKCKDNTVEIAVQVMGKIKARMMIPVEAKKDQVLSFIMKFTSLRFL